MSKLRYCITHISSSCASMEDNYVSATHMLMNLYFNQPDPEKASQHESVERYNLEKLKASMTEEDLAELARVTSELQLKPSAPLKAVPRFSLKNISKKPMQVPLEVI